MYLTIDEYLEYGGQLEDETRFNRHEYRARMYLDMMTLGRITEEIAENESVKRCMYELVETFEQEYQQNLVGVGVSTVKNDDLSVSYGSSGIADAVKNKCAEIVQMYLGNVFINGGMSLLYKGVFNA